MKIERTTCDFCDAVRDGPDGAWVDVVMRASAPAPDGRVFMQSMMGFVDICPAHGSITLDQLKEAAAKHSTRGYPGQQIVYAGDH